MDVLTLRLPTGEVATLDDQGLWHADARHTRKALDQLTPPALPADPDWVGSVAREVDRRLGPGVVVLDRAPVEHVQGRTY